MPIRIPKIFVEGIRVPVGPYAGSLAKPCPCGEPVELGGDRDLYLSKDHKGFLVFYHAGCEHAPGEE